MATENVRSESLERKLRAVLRGTAATTGDAFFAALTRHLAQALGVRFAFVAERTDETRTHVRTLSFWSHDRYRENMEYAVAGTPCEVVMQDEAVFYRDGVQERFAGDAFLAALGVQSYFAIPVRNPHGEVVGHVGAMDTDPMTTDVHRDWILEVFAARTGAEFERKAATARARTLEARLLETKKLDGISQLAAGTAHNLNNALMSIDGYCDLLLAQLGQRDPHRQEVEMIQHVADRSAQQVQQLLAFSRSQVLHLEPADLNVVVQNAERIFRPLIGDRITLTLTLNPTVSLVRADVRQTEQVIVNLALNARDATPDGGSIVIETANVGPDDVPAVTETAPGPHVRVRVRDTGLGMDAETRAHLFEPFFTTKEPREGTGLGLAMAHGVIRQSGGCISVDSEVGSGTTVNIYLPSVGASDAARVGEEHGAAETQQA